MHRVNEKHRPECCISNINGVIITSNYLTNGIYLPPDDRRHYVAWADCTQGDFEDGYFDKLWHWYENGGDRHVAAYLATLDLSGFNAKEKPKKTEAFFSIANANAAPEEVELVEALELMGSPKAVTISQLAAKALTVEHLYDLASWLPERKSRRAIPHRMAQAGYIPVRNSSDKSGLFKIMGSKQAVYAQKDLSLHDQIKAAQELIKQVQAEADASAKADVERETKAKADREAKIKEQAKAEAEDRQWRRTVARNQAEAKAHERAKAEARARLSGTARRALELLVRCINDQGKSQTQVSLEEWRIACKRGGLSSALQQEQRERDFWQAKDELQTEGWIDCWDDVVRLFTSRL